MAETDDSSQEPEHQEGSRPGWWASAFSELAQVTWTPGREAVVLGTQVLAALVAVGILVGVVDVGFSKLSLAIYGSRAATHPLASALLTAGAVVSGLSAVAGIFAQRPKGSGLSSFASLNRSRYATGPRARKLMVATYVSLVAFIALAALANLV